MDWSLVLISQGIETGIEQPHDGAGWGLRVSEEEEREGLDVSLHGERVE